MKPLTVSLVIPAYNEERFIGDCLDQAIANSKGLFSEIIVINNASTDRTKEIAESKGVRVITEIEKGLTRARERGLLEAKGDILAYIDADTRLPNGWSDKLLKVFQDESVVCLSGPYRYYDGVKWKNMVMQIFWYLFAPITYLLVGYMVLGGNFAAKREALKAMGGFDKKIEFYGEDTDIARRLSKFGKVVFKMDFFIYSSSRRLLTEGLFKTNIVYAINFIWQVVFHRPFHKTYKDIRVTKK